MALQHPELSIGLPTQPLVAGEVFGRHPAASYHVGVLAVGNEVLNDPAFTAARRLRFDAYNELGWLPDEARDPDGGEHDKYDSHSAQFGVVKNSHYGPLLIATSRLILKNSDTELLPVEEDYPDVFVNHPVKVGEVEVSRLVSSSSDNQERHMASLALQRAMIGWGNAHGYRYAHAMVEPYLLKIFDKVAIPYEKRSDFREIEEYGNTMNAAITIDSQKMIDQMKTHRVGTPITTALFFRNITKTQGLGYYGKRFIRRYK